ncbi:MAG: HDOD domain-containing protein [Aquisalimonadaceae bacterium]
MLQPIISRGRPLNLPIPTGAASRLLECIGAAVPSPWSLVSILDDDPLLARRFHRLAISTLVDGARRGGSVGEVVMALEPDVLRQVATAAAVMHLLPASPSGLTGEQFDRFRFWEHSAAVGVLSRLMARNIGLDPSQAFVGGLLHDMGRLVLDVHFPREFSAVLQYQLRHDTWIRDAEAAVLGYDHCMIGEQVASAWGLSTQLVEIIGTHHQPERTDPPASQLAAVIHVADILARGLQVGYPGDDAIPMLSEPTLRRLRFNWSQLRDCLSEAEQSLHEARLLVQETMRPE